MYGHMDTQMMGIPFWLFAGLLYMTAVGSSAAIIFRHFPRLAPFVELTTISRFLLALAATQSHDLALALTTSPVLNATLIVSGALAIRAIASARSGARRGIPLATAG